VGNASARTGEDEQRTKNLGTETSMRIFRKSSVRLDAHTHGGCHRRKTEGISLELVDEHARIMQA
jgi:hypothetical protein